MKYLFVDVDGVLNTWPERKKYGIHHICPQKVDRIKQIVDSVPDVKIVLSSTWRILQKNMKMVQVAFSYSDLEIFHKTQNIPYADRCDEIKNWLDNKTFDKYAVIDDTEEADTKHGGFFRTNDNEGLTLEITKNIIKYLKGE